MAEVKVYSFIGKKRNAYDATDYISGTQFCEALTAAEAGADTEIKVSVNSGGGSVTDGYAMISAMKKSTKPVKAVIDGYAASMGYFICLGASQITAATNSMLMLHSVQGSAQGSPEDLIAEAEVLKKFNATIATLLATRTGLTEAEVTEKYLGKEVWFTAAEALELKLIDAIENYEAESVPAVTAGMSYEESVQRFAAMHQKEEHSGIVATVLAQVKALLFKAKAEKKAMLTEQEENGLCYLLYSVKSAADEADYASENAVNPDVKALLDKVMKTNSAFVVEITNLVYGEEIAEPAEPVEARINALLTKAADKKALDVTAKATAAAEKFVAEKLAEKDNLLKAASTEIENLTAENTKLKETPAAQLVKPVVQKGNKVVAAEVEAEFETSFDRAARERREREASNIE